ncbi:MAG: hypothetical protein QW096_11180 [Thermofilaceae archaeon]
MNFTFDHRGLCQSLVWLIETLPPRKARYILISNQLGLYYAKRCMDGYVSPKLLQLFGGYFRDLLREYRKAIHTIEFLNNLLNKVNLEYIYIKTYRPLPYVPNDIDLFIDTKDIPNLMKLLKNNGFKISKHGVEMRCYKKGMTRIDIYTSIVYSGIEFNIKDLIFSTKVSVKFFDNCNIFIPSPDLDALILLLHDILGHRTINYLDYLYIKHALFQNPFSNVLQNILNSDRRGVEVIKRCLALFSSLSFKGRLDNVADFPLMIRPSFVLNILGDISFHKRILYGSSLFIDNFLRLYNIYNNIIPPELKTIVQTALFYHRLLVGDRHTNL